MRVCLLNNMWIVVAFLGLIALALVQDYFQFGLVGPIIYFLGLIILFLIKQHKEEKELFRKHH